MIKNINTAQKAIRQHCIDCCNGSSEEVKQCTSPNCPSFALRMQHSGVPGSRVKVCREQCLDCTGQSYIDVRDCKIDTCPLYNFRFGKNQSRD